MGPASREARRSCPCCHPRLPSVPGACDACRGWRERGQRDRVVTLDRPGCVNARPCPQCGGGALPRTQPRQPRAHTPAGRRAAHASAGDTTPGISHGDVGWRPGTRTVRRLQKVTIGTQPAWVGFAGLQQTVVERLLRHEAAEEPPIGHLADVRHVMGGGCAAGPEYEQAVARLARSIGGLDTSISRAGGAGSSLGITVHCALACVDGTLEERRRQPLRH